MNTAVESLRERLRADRERIVSQIAIEEDRRRALAESSDAERYGNHPGDEGTETFDKENSLAIQSNLENILADIEHAIHKFEDGTYGKCDNCGQDIPLERLEIRPMAALCIKCKSKDEHAVHVAQAVAGRG